MKKLAIAGASVVALAGAAMPMVGVFADDDRSVTDTINVTVDASCAFTQGGDNGTYEANGANGASVQPKTNNTNVHTFTVFCNTNSGYKVSATAHDLTQSGVTDKFDYSATLPSGADSGWNAAIGKTTQSLTIAQLTAADTPTDIVTLGAASVTGGETFTATYSAYIGTETPAGTYTGTIEYTLNPGA